MFMNEIVLWVGYMRPEPVYKKGSFQIKFIYLCGVLLKSAHVKLPLPKNSTHNNIK